MKRTIMDLLEWNIQEVTCSKASIPTVLKQDMEGIYGMMAITTLDSLKTESCKEKDIINLRMAQCKKEDGRTIFLFRREILIKICIYMYIFMYIYI